MRPSALFGTVNTNRTFGTIKDDKIEQRNIKNPTKQTESTLPFTNEEEKSSPAFRDDEPIEEVKVHHIVKKSNKNSEDSDLDDEYSQSLTHFT